VREKKKGCGRGEGETVKEREGEEERREREEREGDYGLPNLGWALGLTEMNAPYYGNRPHLKLLLLAAPHSALYCEGCEGEV
jgi:hypothetical protein